jgi:16S rRNA (uracil1498-N3)-methyltransferase
VRHALWHNFIAMSNAKPLTRIYFPGEIPIHGACALAADQAHHVTRVLRLGAGDSVTLFDGNGSEYAAVIARAAPGGVTVNVGERVRVDRESPLQIALAQAISSGERMDYTIQKAVELGVVRVQPLTTERCVVRLDGARAQKRVAHWQAVAIAACEQCGRNRVPHVAPVMTLREWLARDARTDAEDLHVLLYAQAETTLHALPKPSVGVAMLAGPEGGLAPEEQNDARRAGYVPVKLGPRVLRTETAAVAAIAALQTLWGDF